MPNVGPWEIILLLLLALLLFGAKRLPEIGRSMSKGMREFKDSLGGKEPDDEPAELPVQTTGPLMENPFMSSVTWPALVVTSIAVVSALGTTSSLDSR